MTLVDSLLSKGLLPDWAIRWGIRRLLVRRRAELNSGSIEARQDRFYQFLEHMAKSPIALHTGAANDQHYEIPAAFFKNVLGPHLKYSCGYWPKGIHGLAHSEKAMLQLSCERAELRDGQTILELGCGWGSLTLFMAQRFPNAKITAVSNSQSQKTFIEATAAERQLSNIEIMTADMNDFTIGKRFDRVVSVEMFEHMRNHFELMRRIHGWMRPGGKLFVHIFAHRTTPYCFEDKDPSDWMARYFFTGGMMPADTLLLYCQEHFLIDRHWHVPGWHYQKTSEAWLTRMTENRTIIKPLLEAVYGPAQTAKWWTYWRVFFMACAELFGDRGGTEWFVSHYRFRRRV